MSNGKSRKNHPELSELRSLKSLALFCWDIGARVQITNALETKHAASPLLFVRRARFPTLQARGSKRALCIRSPARKFGCFFCGRSLALRGEENAYLRRRWQEAAQNKICERRVEFAMDEKRKRFTP